MVQQLFDVLFVVTLLALVLAPVVGLLLLALPRKTVWRRVVGTKPMHAHV